MTSQPGVKTTAVTGGLQPIPPRKPIVKTNRIDMGDGTAWGGRHFCKVDVQLGSIPRSSTNMLGSSIGRTLVLHAREEGSIPSPSTKFIMDHVGKQDTIIQQTVASFY